MNTPPDPDLLRQREHIFIFHAGALGDFILIWPLLRTLAPTADVTVVADPSKARLAQRLIPGLHALDANLRPFTRLWTGEPPDPSDQQPGATRVLTFLAEPSDDAGRRWHRAAATMFPGAAIEPVGPIGSDSRHALWRRLHVDELGAVPPRTNPDGPVVCHIGAGSPRKTWPLERWSQLTTRLRLAGLPVVVLAGEAELERLSAPDRKAFARLGGEFLTTLDALADALAPARIVLGADTGPTHLAAQLGLATVALFGPTDPDLWRPVGPQVRIVRSSAARDMSAITVDQVLHEVASITSHAMRVHTNPE